jgi:voltage-gated potassium channel Kch
MWLTPVRSLIALALVASTALVGGCESPPRDAVGVVEYGPRGPASLEFVICKDDVLRTATVRAGDLPTAPALMVNESKAADVHAIPVRIDFGVDAARAGVYSNDVDVEDVRGFAVAIGEGRPVTAVSALFDDTWFSADLPGSIPDGQVLLVTGANAEQTGKLRQVTREVADQELAASCGGN